MVTESILGVWVSEQNTTISTDLAEISQIFIQKCSFWTRKVVRPKFGGNYLVRVVGGGWRTYPRLARLIRKDGSLKFPNWLTGAREAGSISGAVAMIRKTPHGNASNNSVHTTRQCPWQFRAPGMAMRQTIPWTLHGNASDNSVQQGTAMTDTIPYKRHGNARHNSMQLGARQCQRQFHASDTAMLEAIPCKRCQINNTISQVQRPRVHIPVCIEKPRILAFIFRFFPKFSIFF